MYSNDVYRYGRRAAGIFIIICIALLLHSCSDDSDLAVQMDADNSRISNYLAENSISAVRDGSGVYYEVLETNPQGEAVNNDDVLSIAYSIKTLDGELLEESYDSASTLIFHNFQSVVPIGLDYGLDLMRVGEKFRFYIPSTLAYNSYSNSLFETSTNFIAEVTLLSIQSKTDIYNQELNLIRNYLYQEQVIDNGDAYQQDLFYREVEKGTGKAPNSSSTVSINFTRKYLNGTIIERTNSSPVTFQLNTGQAVEGLEMGILKMQEGGKAMLVMPSKLGFGESLQVIPKKIRTDLLRENLIYSTVAPFTPLIYDVELVKVQ